MTFDASYTRPIGKGWKALCLLFVLTLCLCGAVTAQSIYKSNRITAFGEVFERPADVVEAQTRLIFYRLTQHSSVKGAASVYVNGAYHASLVAGAYSQLCMPDGDIELGLKSVEVGRQVSDRLDTITIGQSQSGQNHFFRVQEVAPLRQVLVAVSRVQALTELKGTREQIHTISRVPNAAQCSTKPQLDTRPQIVPAGQSITLNSDELFAQTNVQDRSAPGQPRVS